ncbi:maleamate amidohydrolase [Halalkaliarchaeum desulfuricum]|uniref:Maleamate amidohydrolase n=1 Tax=Halalkaliarchaeum desulfuricum TaxID=2055893 RepID=A0A343THW8_9EURY|nr:isochorismatase family protein [Halalkaliarchaeum desulfuricum]AUX08690.1 maleamate amidohydrolase [Halalkaliarchaeum desulfuricum]
MSERVFGEYYVPDVIPESDVHYFDLDGDRSRRAGWGKSPAILVVDLTRAFTEERPAVSQPCVEATADLLEVARDAGVPVVYTTPTPAGTYPRDYRKPTIRSSDGAPSDEHRQWVQKLDEIVPEVEPEDGEQVFEKPRASAFFDTHLSNYLHHYGIDTLIVAGMSTSGCVRATVVDGHSSNFRMIVPPECVADRSVTSHEVSLFDMDMKYADVTPLATVTERLEADD